MATYKHWEELNNKTLNYGDRIVLKDMDLICRNSWLEFDSHNSRTIKAYLNSDKTIAALLESLYGYSSYRGAFSECKSNDYEALTRVALYLLMQDAGEEEFYIKMPNKKWKKFKTKWSGIIRLNSSYFGAVEKGHLYTFADNIPLETIKKFKEKKEKNWEGYRVKYYKRYFTIGCQQFTYETLDRVIQKIEEYEKSNKSNIRSKKRVSTRKTGT